MFSGYGTMDDKPLSDKPIKGSLKWSSLIYNAAFDPFGNFGAFELQSTPMSPDGLPTPKTPVNATRIIKHKKITKTSTAFFCTFAFPFLSPFLLFLLFLSSFLHNMASTFHFLTFENFCLSKFTCIFSYFFSFQHYFLGLNLI